MFSGFEPPFVGKWFFLSGILRGRRKKNVQTCVNVVIYVVKCSLNVIHLVYITCNFPENDKYDTSSLEIRKEKAMGLEARVLQQIYSVQVFEYLCTYTRTFLIL